MTQPQHGWQRPPLGIVKINWDASFDSFNQKIGIGVVISNHEVKVVGTLRAFKPITLSHFVAESMALLMAVQLCKTVGYDACQLEVDALQVVNLLKFNRLDWSDGDLLIQDVCHLLNTFTS